MKKSGIEKDSSKKSLMQTKTKEDSIPKPNSSKNTRDTPLEGKLIYSDQPSNANQVNQENIIPEQSNQVTPPSGIHE